MKTNRLGGASLGIILSVLVALFLTGCAGNPSSGKDVVVPNPGTVAVALQVTPVWHVGPPTPETSILTYGDSATVKAVITMVSPSNVTSSETIVLPAFRAVKDTALQYTISRNGLTATTSLLVKVGAPSGNTLVITEKPWYNTKKYLQNPDGSWRDIGELKSCISTNPQTLYLDFTSRIPMKCEIGLPDGIFKWGFRKNGTKLYWGGFIDPVTKVEALYDIKLLTDKVMQLVQEISGIEADGTWGTRIIMIEYTR